jgi:hypothetical protein
MSENGCNRPDIIEEYRRLDSSGMLMQARESRRTDTDELIDAILQNPLESRDNFFSQFDSRALSLVNDRIQCGTKLLMGFVEQGRQIDTAGMASLEDFFRQILLQRPDA